MQNRSLKKWSMRTVLGIVLCGWMLVYLPLSVHAQQNARLDQLKQALKDSRSESSRSLTESAIKAELSSQYDLMLKTNDADLVELEKRVARLKQDLLNRRAAKEQMVDIESQRIINEVNGVVWPGDKVSNTRSGRSDRSMRSSTRSRARASTRAEPYHVRELYKIVEYIPENAENAYPDISQMRKVYDAAIAYQSVLQKFPANIVDENDKPLLSWRVQVLQFMGEAESNLYKKFKLDEPWDSEHNLPLLKEMPACFKSSDVEDKTKTTFLRVSRPSSKPSKGPLCFLVKSDPSGSAIEWSKPSSISVEQIEGDSYPYIVLYNDGVVAQLMRGLIGEEDATKFIKTHIGNLMSRDLSEVSNSYASNVQLMAGHEFLKPKFKIGADDARSTGARVDRKRLLDALKAVFATSRAKDPEKVKKMVSGLNVAIIETEAGSFSVAPSDPLSTKANLFFSIVPRDVLLKVSASDHPDFMLFQVRRIDGTLRVVAEYLD